MVDGKMQMVRVTLRPHITLESGTDETRPRSLVEKAHGSCFIGNSVSTPVEIVPAFSYATTERLAS